MRRCERHEGGDREGNFKARVQAGKNALSLSLSLLQVPRHRYTTAILPCTHAPRRLADEILQVRPMAFKVA